MVRSAARTPPHDQSEESAALQYWRAQEEAPLPEPQAEDMLDATPATDEPDDALPTGWWILPVLALSCLLWGGIGALVLL